MDERIGIADAVAFRDEDLDRVTGGNGQRYVSKNDIKGEGGASGSPSEGQKDGAKGIAQQIEDAVHRDVHANPRLAQ